VPRHALLAGQASRSGWRIIFIAPHFYACPLLTPRIQMRPLPTTNKQGTNEMTKTEAMFEVSAEWMKACGYGDEAKAFPVIRTWDARLLPFAELDMGNGRTWDVCTEWRGRFI
jgi:hypothetical protein